MALSIYAPIQAIYFYLYVFVCSGEACTCPGHSTRKKRSEGKFGCQSLLSSLFEIGLIAAAYARLASQDLLPACHLLVQVLESHTHGLPCCLREGKLKFTWQVIYLLSHLSIPNVLIVLLLIGLSTVGFSYSSFFPFLFVCLFLVYRCFWLNPRHPLLLLLTKVLRQFHAWANKMLLLQIDFKNDLNWIQCLGN